MKVASKRGVEIIVYTLSPEHYSIRKKDRHRTIIEKLRNAGVEVRERKNMHEKAVIVIGEDVKVAYSGSLNVLSKDALYLFLETLAMESERQREEE